MDEFKNAKERLKNRDYLNKLIEEVTITKTSDEWVEKLEKVGVPCGPINSIDKVFDDPQVKHLGIAQSIDTIPFGQTQQIQKRGIQDIQIGSFKRCSFVQQLQ